MSSSLASQCLAGETNVQLLLATPISKESVMTESLANECGEVLNQSVRTGRKTAPLSHNLDSKSVQ